MRLARTGEDQEPGALSLPLAYSRPRERKRSRVGEGTARRREKWSIGNVGVSTAVIFKLEDGAVENTVKLKKRWARVVTPP